MIKLLALLLLAGVANAAGPKWQYEDPKLNDEFKNAYHDIGGVLKGNVKISSMTVSSATFASVTISTVSLTSATITNLTVSGAARIKGSTTNDAAIAGNVGEAISNAGGLLDFPATGINGDAASILLTPGDWLTTAGTEVIQSGAGTSVITATRCGISASSSTLWAGALFGTDAFHGGVTATNDRNDHCYVHPMRVSLASNTTYYLKVQAVYTTSTPRTRGRISAWRVR
jgi:hypothetical protein